ncbi:S41 family peptidase [Candidatus Gracilibacteria bacterium]|nr:S41 family peptidase [Candidatus Gracilibacteria bacterium]
MENQNKKYKYYLLFFIIFLTSFSLGFFVSENIKLDDNITKNQDLNSKVGEFIKDKMLKKDLNLNLFWQVYNIIISNYYSSDELKEKTLEYGLIDGLVKSLGDKYSEFMTPEITKEFENTLSGDFEGIGAVIEKNELGVMVDRVLKGSPALESGILKGDIIIKANNKELKDLSANEAVSFIKGQAGTKVELTILRAGEKDLIIKNVTRNKIKIPSVDTTDLKDPEIGYISLNMFGENTANEFKELLDTFNNEKTKGIIIDLRDNGGGYLQTAVEILSNFIKNKEVLVTTKYKDELLNTPYYSENSGAIFNKKIVVLINGNSASASEITAGALKDYNKAILVGEKSYGKGSVQQPFDLPDGSMIKLTIAKWYTPKDYSIDHNGIDPDIKVSFKKEDYENMYDRQLEEAKKILKKYIKLDSIPLTVGEYNKENKTSTGETLK